VIAFLRATKLAGVAALLVLLVLAGGWVDRTLGTGHLVVGLLAGLIVAVGAVVWFILSTSKWAHKEAAKRRGTLKAPLLPDEPAAFYNWRVKALDGSPFEMDGLRRKTLFLNFWSTTCPPCLAELPSIQRLHDVLAREGVVFLCIALDIDVEPVREIVEREHLTLPVFVLGDQDLPPVFDSDYVPATYMIAFDGRVAFQHQGAAQWDHPRVLQFLRGLLMQDVVTSVSGAEVP